MEKWLKDNAHDGYAPIQLYASSEERPKYANRIVGRLWVGELAAGGDCLNDTLLEWDMVKPYQGGKRHFTDEELKAICEEAEAFLI